MTFIWWFIMKQQDISLLMKIASTSGNESAVTETLFRGGEG